LSAEDRAPSGLGVDVLPLAAHRVHHALALARVYLGEGARMATEAGLLGTPSVYVSTLVGTMGNFELLAAEGLVQSFRSGGPAIQAAVGLMEDSRAGVACGGGVAACIDRQDDTTEVTRRHVLAVGTR